MTIYAVRIVKEIRIDTIKENIDHLDKGDNWSNDDELHHELRRIAIEKDKKGEAYGIGKVEVMGYVSEAK